MTAKEGIYKKFIDILINELQVAYGCTEPASIAYSTALATSLLDGNPDCVSIYCSSNILKNVKSVVIPFTGGRRGIEAAAAAGIAAKDYDRKLEILSKLSDDSTDEILAILSTVRFSVNVVESDCSFYLFIKMTRESHVSEVCLKNGHTSVVFMKKDDEILYSTNSEPDSVDLDYEVMNIASIYDFAANVDINAVKDILDMQIADNAAIAEKGIAGGFGAEVGVSLYNSSKSIEDRVTAFAAAGSDARMAGCKMPVIINSGSGNQGITVSVPLIMYAREKGIANELLYRGLLLSNLLAIYQRHGIGCLSAYCGAVNAGISAICGIELMEGYSFDIISHTLEVGLATASGMICDGAKSSCASKIAIALKAGWLGRDMALRNKWFGDGEGIVKADVDSTISAVARLGNHGMRSVDKEIIGIMLS